MKKKKPKIVWVPIDKIRDPWGGDERVKLEVKNAERRYSAHPEAFNCRKCGKLFQPKPYQYIYYDLCDDCFKVFDTQKMLGREATLSKKSGYVHHFEDVYEWIRHGEN